VIPGWKDSPVAIMEEYDNIGRRAGDYLRQFHCSHGLALGDALIAAAAAVHGCALWTRNRKHYPMEDIELV
jgi:predicted nucleic acid-binding protein